MISATFRVTFCCSLLFPMNSSIKIASWNVRRLGRPNKCTDIKKGLQSPSASIICLQETKLQEISSFKAISFLPLGLRSYHFLPSIGASSGVLTAWVDANLECTKVQIDRYAISCWFSFRANDTSFVVTNVYGPCDHASKSDFLDSLIPLSQMINCPWTIMGDFNLVLRPSDKSSANFNANEASIFASAINSLHLQEVPLLDRLYTWSNQ